MGGREVPAVPGDEEMFIDPTTPREAGLGRSDKTRVGGVPDKGRARFVSIFQRISPGGWVFSDLRASEVGMCHGLGGRRDLLGDGPSLSLVT